MNTYDDNDGFLGVERIGNKTFSWKSSPGSVVHIYADGSRGPSICLTMSRSVTTGALGIRNLGGWRLSVDQLKWAVAKCFELIEG